MRKHFSFLLTFILGSGIFLTGVTPAFACSCMNPRPPQEALKDAKAVFAGKVTKVDSNPLDKMFGSKNVSFDVSKSWKAVDSTQLTIETPRDEAGCGFNFEVGKEYIVYASGEDVGQTTVTSCSRTALLSDTKEDLIDLGAGTVLAGTPAASLNPDASPDTSNDYVLPENGFMYISLGLMLAIIAIPVVLALLTSKKKSS